VASPRRRRSWQKGEVDIGREKWVDVGGGGEEDEGAAVAMKMRRKAARRRCGRRARRGSWPLWRQGECGGGGVEEEKGAMVEARSRVG
jgi:hypothetical protein